MRKALVMECSADQFHGLHVALDKTRQGSKTVTVDREALRLLLADHGKLHGEFGQFLGQAGSDAR